MTQFSPLGHVASLLGVTTKDILQLHQREDCPADITNEHGHYNIVVVMRLLEETGTIGEPKMTVQKRRGRPPKNAEEAPAAKRRGRKPKERASIAQPSEIEDETVEEECSEEESPDDAFKQFVRGFWEEDNRATDYLSQPDLDWTLHLVHAALEYAWRNR